jgi:preprotein translocase subunit SecD
MRRAGPILILIIGVLALIVDFVPGLSVPDSSDSGSRVLETKLGLDLQGGLRVEYQAQPVDGKFPDAAARTGRPRSSRCRRAPNEAWIVVRRR